MNIVVDTCVEMSVTEIRKALMNHHEDDIVEFILGLLGDEGIVLTKLKEKLEETSAGLYQSGGLYHPAGVIKRPNKPPFGVVSWGFEYNNNLTTNEPQIGLGRLHKTVNISFYLSTLEEKKNLDKAVTEGRFTWDLPFRCINGTWENITVHGLISDVETKQKSDNIHEGTLTAFVLRRSDNEKG